MLLKQTALTLGLAVSSCFAATYQKCSGFLDPVEGSKYTPSLRIKAGKNDGASVLVFELKDSLNTNIDINGIDDSNLLNSTNNNFFLCTQEFLDAGKCDELDTFNLEIKEEQQIKKQIMNKHLKANERLEYEIDAKGVYCVAAYSKARRNVNILAMQSFGHASLQNHYKAEFLKYLVVPASVIVSLISHMSFKKTSRAESPLEHSILVFSICVTIYNISKLGEIELYNSQGWWFYMKGWALLSSSFSQFFCLLIEAVSTILIVTVLYFWSVGSYVLVKSPQTIPETTSVQFYYLVCWLSIDDNFAPPHTSKYFGYAKTIAGLALFCELFKNSWSSLNAIRDSDVKRNYRLSITVSLLVPLLMGLTCIFASIIVDLNNSKVYSNNYYSLKDVQTELLVSIMEKSLMSRKLIYLRSFPDLIYVALGLAYTVIWARMSPKQVIAEKEEDEETLEKEEKVDIGTSLRKGGNCVLYGVAYICLRGLIYLDLSLGTE